MTREAFDRPRTNLAEPASASLPPPPFREEQPRPVLPVSAPDRSRWWVWLLVLLVIAALGYVVYRFFIPHGDAAGGAGKRAMGPVPVVAVPAREGELPIYLTGLGTVTPLNTVTVRTRVDGQVEQVAFTEGQLVHAGDLLAQIDPRPFQVQLEQAQGQSLKDQAALANARADLSKYQQAGEAISRQQVETQAATVKQAEGAVQIDQAAIDNANLQLTYARITAPITGRIGLRLIDPGNIVHATDANGIAVINQVQPITVVFPLPQDDIHRVLEKTSPTGRATTQVATQPSSPPAQGAGAATRPYGEMQVDAFNRDLTAKIATGRLLAIDNQVDPLSGTVRLKAIFSNENEILYPNQFVNARLLVDVRRNAVIVPAAAVQRGPNALTFVYVVQKDHSVKLHNVVVGPTENERTVVEEGVAPGDLVVTDGVDKLQDGTKVEPRARSTTRPAGAGAAATQPGGAHGGKGEGDAGGAGRTHAAPASRESAT